MACQKDQGHFVKRWAALGPTLLKEIWLSKPSQSAGVVAVAKWIFTCEKKGKISISGRLVVFEKIL
jgi:hypothetical protein